MPQKKGKLSFNKLVEPDTIEEVTTELESNDISKIAELDPVETGFIPIEFKVTGKPEIITLKNIDNFDFEKEIKDKYHQYLKQGKTVKLFKLSEPIAEVEAAELYQTQYEIVAYTNLDRIQGDRLNSNFGRIHG